MRHYGSLFKINLSGANMSAVKDFEFCKAYQMDTSIVKGLALYVSIVVL